MKRIFTLFFLLLALTVDAGSKYYGSFTGDASGLTNLTGSGIFSGLNLIPSGAVYTNNADVGFPSYGVSLSSNTLYIYYQEPNSGGLFSGDGGATYPASVPGGGKWTGYFTVPTNGVYLFLDANGGSAGDLVLCQIYASNNVTIPVSLTVEGNLNLGTPLAVTSGGTGVTSLGGFAAQVGTVYLGTSSDMWAAASAATPAYLGQLATQNTSGSAQATELFAASTTSTGSFTNSQFRFPTGIFVSGDLTRMPFNSGNFQVILAGNPRLQTNVSLDASLNVINTSAYSSGSSVSFAWVGTNITLGNQSGAYPPWVDANAKTNYMHDFQAMAIGHTPDGTSAGLIPSSGWIVMDNRRTFSLLCAVPPNGSGFTSGNYSFLQTDPGISTLAGNHYLLRIPQLVSGAYTYTNASWLDTAVFDLSSGTTTIAGSGGLIASTTLTVTNLATLSGGIATGATNTYSVTTGGFTNTGTKNVQLYQFFGVGVKLSNSTSHVSYTLSDRTNTYVLKPGCSLTGTSCTVIGIEDF